MKHYKKVKIPEHYDDLLVNTTCDLCGEDTIVTSSRFDIDMSSRFDIDMVRIVHKWGESYPECGSGEVVNIDMCPKCFVSKLEPWLKDNGVDIKTEEWDN